MAQKKDYRRRLSLVKIRTDYLQETFEYIKSRNINGRTLVDFKDDDGNVGTANANIFELIDGTSLLSYLNNQGANN
jgi:hypothetical protein